MPNAGPLAKANSEALCIFAMLGVIFLIAATGIYISTLSWTGPFPRDASNLVVGRDFLNFWMYGKAAFSPVPWRWYDIEIYQRELAALLGDGYPGQNWSYPPSIMLLAAPFGIFNYFPALCVWSIAGLAIFSFALWRLKANKIFVIAALASPAALFCLMSGQNSFFTTALLIGIFSQIDRRPALAGILIGLLTLKPQTGLLLPIVLLASRRWKVLSWATLIAAALAAVTAALFGAQSWSDFFMRGLPAQNLVLIDANGVAAPFQPTIFMNLRLIGTSYGLAMAAQASVALAVACGVFRAFQLKNASPNLLFALYAACSVAASPYMLIHDTLPLTVAILFLIAEGRLDIRGHLLAPLIYWLPVLQVGLGTKHIPGPAFIAPIFALYVLNRLCTPANDKEGKSSAFLLAP